jgi:hypothetical protein
MSTDAEGGPRGPVPVIALVGAPRSGTTWLQHLVGADPAVATPQETALFSRYVAGLDEHWRWGLRGSADDWARRRFTGLASVYTEERFVAFVRDFVDQVLRDVLALKPGARIVLEKTPAHSLHVELIARYAPQARFLHIIRDGRDVATSLVAASQSWGAAWGAPATVSQAARVWAEHVEAARRAAALGPYCELRYEDLRGECGGALLQQVFEFCGVAAGEDEVRRRLEEFSLASQRGEGRSAIVLGGEAGRHTGSATEPEGFFRDGAGSWRDTWSTRERAEFHDVAGALLVELGYEPDDAWLGRAPQLDRARRAIAARRFVARAMRGGARRLERLAERVANRSRR